jgi:hypothetical protein
MVFGIGGPWSTLTQASSAKKNKTSVVSGTGADLATLTKSQHVLVKCDADGGGLLNNHVYFANTAGDAFLDLSGIAAHTHSSAADGGTLFDIVRPNFKFMDTGPEYMFNSDIAKWVQTVGLGGAVTNDTDGTTLETSVKIDSLATSGGNATIGVRGPKLDFSKNSQFQVKLKLNNISTFAIHCGVNADDITAVDSNTQKYNAEVCTVTNNNWFLRSANGTSKTTSDTGTLATTAAVSIRIEHFPEQGVPDVDMYINGGTVFQKSSDVPITGTTGVTTLMKHSIKNSAAASRFALVHLNRLRYYINDTWL